VFLICCFNEQLREDVQKGVYVENLTEFKVESVHDVLTLIIQVLILNSLFMCTNYTFCCYPKFRVNPEVRSVRPLNYPVFT
jgi:hypothetical protein